MKVTKCLTTERRGIPGREPEFLAAGARLRGDEGSVFSMRLNRRALRLLIAPGEVERPRWLLALSLVSMVAAGMTAFVVGVFAGGNLFCTVNSRLSGAEIPAPATEKAPQSGAFCFLW
jgi:hypothetical protein